MTSRLLVGGELLLYGDVGDMWGDGSGFSAKEVIEALAEHGEGPLTVRINSGGGYVKDGVSIYNSLKAHAGKITTSCDGIAASAASVILMAGEDRIVREGSLVMIHDPAAITVGDARDHEQTAAVLNKIGDQIAGIYAGATGESAEEMRRMMLAETWLDAEEAETFGFANKKDDEAKAVAAARFDYALYQRAPETLKAAQRARPEAPAAVAALSAASAAHHQEPLMAEGTTAAVAPVAPAAPQKKDETREIMNRCKAAKLSLDETAAIVDAADGDLDKAKDLIINKIAERDPDQGRTAAPALVTADARDKFATGVEKALLAKAGMTGGERNEYTGMTLREVARESIVMSGGKATFADPMAMVAAALGMGFRPVTMAAGQHSTSDFVQILANVASKSMMRGYDEAEETFDAWTAKGSLVDFKPAKRVDLNLFPSLAEVPEGAEYTLGTIGDRGESIQLATYGKMFAITRQAIINDDLNAFTRIPMRMGRAAKRTIGNLAYAVLTDNAALSDAIALFHASHSNLAAAGGAPSVTTLDAARSAMAKQKDPDGNAAALNIRPKWFLVPVALEGVARTLMDAEKDPLATNANASKPNHVRGLATVVSDARLDANSATAWYLAADANMHDTIEVAYLNGVEVPVMEQREGWNVDGVEFKVRIDAGVKALDFRGLYKNPGA